MIEQPGITVAHYIRQAKKMGYTHEDLEPITMQKVIRNSDKILKGMPEDQQQYYLEKKFKALQERQTKIVNSVHEQMANTKTRSSNKGFNPVIKKLLEDHEMRLERKARYDEKVRISKTRQAENRKVSNTIDLGRTSPNFSKNDNLSRASKRSAQSHDSRFSSSSKGSHRDRLELVRLKEKEAERYKKKLFHHNESESRKKIDKVRESRLSLSRRIKTKSEISQQAVQERKQELMSMQHEEIRNHIEKLKYKMMKNQYIRQRHQEKKLTQAIPYDNLYKKQLKSMLDQNEREQTHARYEQKIRSIERKKKEVEEAKKMELEYKSKQQKRKQLQMLKFREHMMIEGENRKQQTLFYGETNLERAKNRKMEIQSEKKMKLLESRVKQEIVRDNFNSIENRRKVQSQAKGRQIYEKLREIEDIQEIKRKLARETKRNSFVRTSESNHKFSFY